MTRNENKDAFFSRLEPRLSPTELTWVRAAYIFAKFGHRAQLRKEVDEKGQPIRYFEHVRRTALVLMDELGIFDPEMIASALLHDCLEDTEDVDAHLIEHMFGSRVARNVRCLTNIPKEGYYGRLSTSGTEVLTIKFCDRLDNVRTFGAGGTTFARRKANETIMTYLPMFKDNLINVTPEATHLKVLLDEMEEKCERFLSQ